MKKTLVFIFACWICFALYAQDFNTYFTDMTLRLDYIFAGNATNQEIYLDGLYSTQQWAGRRKRLSELPLQGNGKIVMKDKETGMHIYSTSFSSLFQEWIETEEVLLTQKSFENTFLVPYPLRPVEIEVVLYNNRREITASFNHEIDPEDILIRCIDTKDPAPHRYLMRNGDPAEKINVVILAEGYTEEEMEIFYQDAETACESIFTHEPFRSLSNEFNVIAVASASRESGVSIPHQHIWKHTVFSSHFDTFYSERYLTTSRIQDIHHTLAGIPYEHIIILANTAQYGGGGIYNAFTLTTAHHPMFRPVVVHEFGHSFAGLGDEYFYEEDIMSDFYPLDIEPWEQNITTLVDFSSKWENMLPPQIPIPTPVSEKENYPVGVYEGGGYSVKGVYRPADNCRMRTNEYPAFCPVCQRAIKRIIEFYTK